MNIKVDVDGSLIEFKEIGQFNVICGPNSSGKSTLLNSIKALTLRGFPLEKIFPFSDIDEIIEDLFTPYPGAPSGPVDFAKSAFRNALVEASREVVYLNEVEVFVNSFRPLWETQFPRQVQFSNLYLQSILSKEFGPQITATLVPPKRHISTYSSIELASSLGNWNGNQTVSGIFRAQNSRSSIQSLENVSKLEKAFENITSGIKYEIDLTERGLELLFRFPNQELIHADSCGLGLQDLLVILYAAIFTDDKILLVEEPESHLHPQLLRSLALWLKRETNLYIFVATHSSTLLDAAIADRVFGTSISAGAIQVADNLKRIEILRDLGIARTDYMTAKVLVLVEGPGDRLVVEHYLNKLHPAYRGQVAFEYLGGDNCIHFKPEHRSEAFEHVVAFLDSELDPGTKKVRRRTKSNLETANIQCTLSELPAIEYYFPPSSYRQVYPHISFPDSWDTKSKLKTQVPEFPENKLGLDKLAAATDWGLIANTDLGEFITFISEIIQR